MLDREDAVIAAEAEIGDEVTPIGLAVTVADGTEDPSAMELIAVVLGIENTVLCGVIVIDFGILCMNVVDGACQLADRGNGIHALPNEVRGIEVCADNITDRRAETEQCFGVIDAKARVHFECDMRHVVCESKSACFLPIGDDAFIPLPIENGEKVLGPRAGDPVGIFRACVVTWAAGKGDDGINAHFFGKENGVAKIGIELCRNLFVGVQSVSVSGKRANGDIISFKSFHKCIKFCIVDKKLRRVALCRTGVSAGSKLNGVYAERGQCLQSLFQGFVVIQICQYT